MDTALRSRIEQMISGGEVVLFMKGTRHFPQCGFSATVVQILDQYLPKYETINVLSDNDVREGIKAFSSWPTIPQLYVRGEFVGGRDIVVDLYQKGELDKLLGKSVEVAAPKITITESAQNALREAAGQEEGALHFEVGPKFEHGLYFEAPSEGAIVADVGGLKIHMNRSTAMKSDGVTIDFVERAGGAGFKIDNPNAPAMVKPISPAELKAKLDAGPVELFDVRGPDERNIAKIDGSRLLDAEAQQHIQSLDRSTELVFHCHMGQRSQAAAEHFLRLGFRNAFNLAGGIDAWSQQIDPGVPRY